MPSQALRVLDLYPARPDLFSALIRRFWANVEERGPNECWPFKGYRTTAGYGMTRVLLDGGYRGVYAHRLAYLFVVDDIAEGAVIRHSCDNPPCCNGAHLLSGTQADNIADREARGRGGGVLLRGEGHPRAKLSWEGVRQMRAQRAQGVSVRELVARYGVSEATVYAVLSGRSWREAREAA